MTLDSSLTPSIADENKGNETRRFPKGIHITEADDTPAPGIETLSSGTEGNEKHSEAKPWGYILLHNRRVEAFKESVENYNRTNPEKAHECFIHYSTRYQRNTDSQGIKKKRTPTLGGIVFLQGETKELQEFLHANFPQLHLINNCATHMPASIEDRVMRPFMAVVNAHPESITFLRDPFVKFAKDHTKLRVLTGIFKGLEGYIVRVDRNRQLVMEFGGYAVAIRGVHNEDFAVAE